MDFILKKYLNRKNSKTEALKNKYFSTIFNILLQFKGRGQYSKNLLLQILNTIKFNSAIIN